MGAWQKNSTKIQMTKTKGKNLPAHGKKFRLKYKWQNKKVKIYERNSRTISRSLNNSNRPGYGAASDRKEASGGVAASERKRERRRL